MASLDHDHHSSNGNPPSAESALEKAAPCPSEKIRRNRLNMEKMIMKNVAASRNSTKNRAQQILEALKKKRQRQEDASYTNADESDHGLKRTKTSPPHDEKTVRTAVAASILSPARRTSGHNFTSPARRSNPPLPVKSPLPPMVSPARPRSGNMLLLSSPMRPPRNSVVPSPAKQQRSGPTSSPLTRSEFLTSPLRHRASASPKRPLMFDDNEASTSTRAVGQPPLLASALDQVEGVSSVKTTKPMNTTKSPFQSFQAKVNPFSATIAEKKSCTNADGDVFVVNAPRSGSLTLKSHTVSSGSLHSTAAASTSSTASLNASNADANSDTAANNVIMMIDGSNRTRTSSVDLSTTSPKQAVRKFFPSTRPVIAKRSICFSTTSVATALDVTPDGEIIVVGFMDGSVRLYEMDSSIPSDRHGYLLGHLDEQASQGSSYVHMRVKISPDGRYVFAGDRQRRRVVMSITLDHYRSEKDGEDEDLQQFQKHFHSNAKLRGFADVTTYVQPEGMHPPSTTKRSAYYILTGLGVGNLNLWRFVEPERYQEEPTWEYLQTFMSGGNTAMMAAFLSSSKSSGVLAIAVACRDKNLRVWPMQYTKASLNSRKGMNDDSATETEDKRILGGFHAVSNHFSIQNTTDVVAIHGQYVYGISLMGEAYRFCLPELSSLSSTSCERLARQMFGLEKIGGGGGSSKSRRSNVMLESLAASDDGKALVAVSSDGIFYYSNKLPVVDSKEAAVLRIIGKNASENTMFKAPMKVYTPKIVKKDIKMESEAMMAVVTNSSGEDSESASGYINVDPTEAFAARWLVPSRSQDCWVCGVRNVKHWVGPPESKVKESSDASSIAISNKKMRNQRQERILKTAKFVAAPSQIKTCARNLTSSVAAKSNIAAPSSATEAVVQNQPSVQLDVNTSADKGIKPTSSVKAHRTSQHSGAFENDDDDNTGSDDSNTPLIASLMGELEHFKKRNAEIKTEWQRRLQGERQLRRKWKQREEEFLDQLNESLTKLDAAEMEVDQLRVLMRDAEKRFAFEKARSEQENSVKSRYERLCLQLNDKMTLLSDQKRLLEQTTCSLLAEVDRNVHALKNAVCLEKSECVVCKDRQAVTAVVPCGHMCFCEQDAETYRRNCTTEYPTCPICQQEIVSLLRVYS